jgi:DNA polymerase III epsilon subunit-like protein
MSGAELFISVDVEASGAYPGDYSLLSIGACAVDAPHEAFSCELKPVSPNADPKAMEVSGLSIDALLVRGLDPEEAMRRFGKWATDLALPTQAKLVFVGFNAGFDWAFVNHYFLRFTGVNPFGFAPLDIKAFYMGLTGSTWADTRSSVMSEQLAATLKGDHNALHDALYQAELFRLARAVSADRRTQREGDRNVP